MNPTPQPPQPPQPSSDEVEKTEKALSSLMHYGYAGLVFVDKAAKWHLTETSVLRKERDEALANYTLAHETLGGYVVRCGELQSQLTTAQADLFEKEKVLKLALSDRAEDEVEIEKIMTARGIKLDDGYAVKGMPSLVKELDDLLTTAQADAAGMREALEGNKHKDGCLGPKFQVCDCISYFKTKALSTTTGQQILQELGEKTDALKKIKLGIPSSLNHENVQFMQRTATETLSRYPDREQSENKKG